MTDSEALNPEQRTVVQRVNGRHVVLVGAGSGQTRTLTYRIADILDQSLACRVRSFVDHGTGCPAVQFRQAQRSDDGIRIALSGLRLQPTQEEGFPIPRCR